MVSLFKDFQKIIFEIFHDFMKDWERNFFEQRSLEIDVRHKFYMVKRNISFFPVIVDFLETVKTRHFS